MKKWYLQTWFIAIMFALWFLYGIPLIIGIVLLFIQRRELNKLNNSYGTYDELQSKISSLSTDYAKKNAELAALYSQQEEKVKAEFLKKEELLQNSFNEKEDLLNKKLSNLQKQQEAISTEIADLETEAMIAHYNFSDYDGLTSEECKNKLALIKQQEKDFLKAGDALHITSDGKKKEINDNCKQILRCFNAECDNILTNLSVKNIDSMRNKISKSFESLNKIFSVDGIAMNNKLLEMKLEELNLSYTFALKREQEKEQQKAIKEQMIEEEKIRREIERQKQKIEKDQMQFNNEITKLMSYVQKTQSDVEKQLYIDKIKELESKLSELEEEKKNVLEREANARAGFVYVISNIGSFGEDIYKIGMTRRLEPMDRIKELSSASVPFEFDVHAMIFSDNAPELESILHRHFEKQSVNRVNLRKEFFHVSLDEIESVVKENFNNTVEFIRIPSATEYRQTLEILKNENA